MKMASWDTDVTERTNLLANKNQLAALVAEQTADIMETTHCHQAWKEQRWGYK